MKRCSSFTIYKTNGRINTIDVYSEVVLVNDQSFVVEFKILLCVLVTWINRYFTSKVYLIDADINLNV